MEEKPTPVCRHWQRKGLCLLKSNCKFAHPPNWKGVVEQRNECRSGLDGETGRSKRKRVRNSGRAACFRRFLLDTFGVDLLRSGSGVLDVAGGKGELSFELTNLNFVESTVIDPRPVRYRIYRKRMIWGCYHRSGALSEYIHCEKPLSTDQMHPPNHIPILFDLTLWRRALSLEHKARPTDEDVTSDSNDAGWFADTLRRCSCLEWTNKGISVRTEEGEKHIHANNQAVGSIHLTPMDHRHNGTNVGQTEVSLVREWRAAQDIMQNCSIVVGMHPDQAAEYIVDAALLARKPFALVPCCTYSQEFPGRRLKNGKDVRSYNDLIVYLCEKNSDIQTSQLPFEGKNVVVFWKPL